MTSSVINRRVIWSAARWRHSLTSGSTTPTRQAPPPITFRPQSYTRCPMLKTRCPSRYITLQLWSLLSIHIARIPLKGTSLLNLNFSTSEKRLCIEKQRCTTRGDLRLPLEFKQCRKQEKMGSSSWKHVLRSHLTDALDRQKLMQFRVFTARTDFTVTCSAAFGITGIYQLTLKNWNQSKLRIEIGKNWVSFPAAKRACE